MKTKQTHRCSGRVFDNRMIGGWPCGETRSLVRRGKEWWCRHLDPKAKAAKRKTQFDAWEAQQRADARVEREGLRLARRLGVKRTYCERYTGGTVAKWHTRRVLCVPFEEVEKLLKRAGKPVK